MQYRWSPCCLRCSKLFFSVVMTNEKKLTVPAERDTPPVITPVPSFNHLLSHRGAQGPFPPLNVWESSPESALMLTEDWRQGCAKVEQNPAERLHERKSQVVLELSQTNSFSPWKSYFLELKRDKLHQTEAFSPIFHFVHVILDSLEVTELLPPKHVCP